MNKTELIDAIAKTSGLTKTDSAKALDGFIAVVKDALKKKTEIPLIGFGTFSVGERAQREGMNPQTKQKITIPAHSVVKFKPSSKILD